MPTHKENLRIKLEEEEQRLLDEMSNTEFPGRQQQIDSELSSIRFFKKLNEETDGN